MSDTVSLLIEARKKIEHPRDWTKGSLARNNYGGAVGSRDPDAVCFCIVGALNAVTPNDTDTHLPSYRAAYTALTVCCNDSPEFFNDDPDTTHADVLNAFDKAIARERNKV